MRRESPIAVTLENAIAPAAILGLKRPSAAPGRVAEKPNSRGRLRLRAGPVIDHR